MNGTEEGGTRVLEKYIGEAGNLVIHLGQRTPTPFGRPIPHAHPRTGEVAYETFMDVVMDCSLSTLTWKNYYEHSLGKDSRQRILILLYALKDTPELILGYPTTAIAEVTGVARSTTKRLLWQLSEEDLVKGGYPTGGRYVDADYWPRWRGPIREYYWTLTDKGWKEAEALMRVKVVPLAPPGELIERPLKQMAEKFWEARKKYKSEA